jgi:hypothetical protein
MTVTPWVVMGNIYFRRWGYLDIRLFLLPFFLIFLYFAPCPSLDMASKNYSNILMNYAWALSVILLMTSFVKRVSWLKQPVKIVMHWGGQTMFLFIAHPYTNNISYILCQKIGYEFWVPKLGLSLILLQGLLVFKRRFHYLGPFKYV